MKIKRLVIYCFAALAVINFTGCSTVTSETYTRGAIQSSRASVSYDPLSARDVQYGTIKVKCFTESRERNGKERHNLWMAYLPVLCVTTYWDRPGWMLWGSDQGAYKPVGLDMAEVICDELKASGQFKKVLGPNETGDADFIIEGDVQELNYKTNPHLCGASVFFAPLVGAVGAPLGNWSIEQKVKLRIRLTTGAASDVLWSEIFTTGAHGRMAAYYGGNPMQFGYPYEEAFKPVVSGLLRDIPGVLKDISIVVADKTNSLVTAGNGTKLAVIPPVSNGAMIAKIPAPASNGLRWAVVVGISKYQDSRIPALRYAESDAKSFHRWLVSAEGGGYAPANVKLLTGVDATTVNIRDALFAWLQHAVAEDQVTIYFAGHGSSDSPDSTDNLFLLPYDTDYSHISSTAFPMWDVETALKRYIKARRVVVIADACHSAGVGEGYDIARRAGRGMKVNPIENGLDRLASLEEGTCVISASSGSQTSQEGEQWGGGHGVFTYYLLKGLRGEADFSSSGRITLGKLTQYVSEQVRRETRSAQTPIVSGRYDPSWAIGQKNAPKK